ncbi:MAG: transposase [Lentisphaeria bacterium]|nr:MAG: transposase [Lentisphaeria bacterium]
MNDLPKPYFTMETYLFPLLEEELCELTAKMKEFLRIVEMIKPSRFITSTLRWSGLGRPMKDREKMLRAFFLKAVYDFPTTKGLIENLKTNPSLRRLCGWEYRGEVPSEATLSRAFGIFPGRKSAMQSMRQLFGKIIPTNWWDTQALIQPQSSVAKKLAAKTSRSSSSRRNAGEKV